MTRIGTAVALTAIVLLHPMASDAAKRIDVGGRTVAKRDLKRAIRDAARINLSISRRARIRITEVNNRSRRGKAYVKFTVSGSGSKSPTMAKVRARSSGRIDVTDFSVASQRAERWKPLVPGGEIDRGGLSDADRRRLDQMAPGWLLPGGGLGNQDPTAGWYDPNDPVHAAAGRPHARR